MCHKIYKYACGHEIRRRVECRKAVVEPNNEAVYGCCFAPRTPDLQPECDAYTKYVDKNPCGLCKHSNTLLYSPQSHADFGIAQIRTEQTTLTHKQSGYDLFIQSTNQTDPDATTAFRITPPPSYSTFETNQSTQGSGARSFFEALKHRLSKENGVQEIFTKTPGCETRTSKRAKLWSSYLNNGNESDDSFACVTSRKITKGVWRRTVDWLAGVGTKQN